MSSPVPTLSDDDAACYAVNYDLVDKYTTIIHDIPTLDLDGVRQYWKVTGYWKGDDGTCKYPKTPNDIAQGKAQALKDGKQYQSTIENPNVLLDDSATGPMADAQKHARIIQQIHDGVLSPDDLTRILNDVRKHAQELANQHLTPENPTADAIFDLARKYIAPGTVDNILTLQDEIKNNTFIINNERKTSDNIYSNGDQKIHYRAEESELLEQINAAFLLIYYLLCIIFLYIIMANIVQFDINTIARSIAIFLFLLAYPFFIFIIETYTYNAMAQVYNTFIAPTDNYTDRKEK